MKIRLAFIGVDRWLDPVVWIMDTRRRFPMAVRPDGRGKPPDWPIREMTEQETGNLSDHDADCLFLRMKDVKPTTYRLQERWYVK